jgi:hypothetical protein
MPFQVSPGVNISEIDLTTVVPSVSTTTGAIAGLFRWGPTNERVLVTSEVELARRFGKPLTGYNIETFFTAADFLSYSNALYVVRADDGTEATSVVGSVTSIAVDNAGSNYEEVPSITISSLTGQGATAVAIMEVGTVSIGTNPGTDYEVGDTLTITAGTGESATFEVTSIGANGDVTGVAVTNAGSYSGIIEGISLDDLETTTDSTAGADAELTIRLQVKEITVVTGGSGYLSAPTITFSANTGSGAEATASLSSASITAKYKGELGNTLKVEIFNRTTWLNANTSTTFVGNTQRAPSSDDNVHVIVVDEDGQLTGTINNVLEVFEDLSLTAGARTDDGTNNYLRDAINLRSNYIKFSESEDVSTLRYASVSLATGSDVANTETNEATVDLSTITDAYDLFISPEDVDISIVMQGKAIGTNNDSELAEYIIQNICESRKDCIATISPALADVVNNAGNETTDILAYRANLTASSYAFMDSGYKYRYDKYNDRYVYTPLNGDIAGLMVRTDDVRDPWWSPAGYSRGILKNVVKLAYNPKKAERDELYKSDVNPVITQPGQGTLLFGDKTLYARSSAFDRINVRRLFITIEKAIANASKSTLFEFNDEFTRAQFRNLIEPFLRDVQGRRGIYDFKVVCDDTNNTDEIIDRAEFRGDIYIKPARSINYIQLNFVAVRTGVEFEEIVGQF